MSDRTKSSAFMLWAKTEGKATYHLGSSGLTSYPLSGLPISPKDLEITGENFYGYPPLLDEIAKKHSVKQEQVFSSIGTSLANHIAMATLLSPGDEVLIEHPVYELLVSTAQYLGANIKRFHRRFENGFQIDLNELSSMVTSNTKLIVLTNLHNPSSVFTNENTLKEIGRIARKVDARVLVDEVYLDALFDSSAQSSIHLGKEFVVTNSLTKVYGLSGLRCGWVLAEPELITAMWRLNDLFEVNPAHPAERMSVIAFKNLDRITTFARSILSANHLAISQFLKSRNDLTYVHPGYGTVVFPKLQHGNVDVLLDLLRNSYDTSIAPGRFFEMPDHFRIGLGVAPEIMEAGLLHLRMALDLLASRE